MSGLRDKSYNEVCLIARQAQKSADLGRMLRDLTLEGGPVAQVMCGFLEARDALMEPLANMDIVSEEGRARALQQQGMLRGIDICLNLIYALMSEETSDAK